MSKFFLVLYCKQISFQEFKNKLLEPGLVDRIEVTNKSLAKVYVYKGNYRQFCAEENIVSYCCTVYDSL